MTRAARRAALQMMFDSGIGWVEATKLVKLLYGRMGTK